MTLERIPFHDNCHLRSSAVVCAIDKGRKDPASHFILRTMCVRWIHVTLFFYTRTPKNVPLGAQTELLALAIFTHSPNDRQASFLCLLLLLLSPGAAIIIFCSPLSFVHVLLPSFHFRETAMMAHIVIRWVLGYFECDIKHTFVKGIDLHITCNGDVGICSTFPNYCQELALAQNTQKLPRRPCITSLPTLN